MPKTARPLFPSVLRLVQEHALSQASVDQIKGTGVRGMLTKGDVLAHLGLASAPTGTYREPPPPAAQASASAATPPPAPLDGPAVRRLIVGSMLAASVKARAAAGECLAFPSRRARAHHERAQCPSPRRTSTRSSRTTSPS